MWLFEEFYKNVPFKRLIDRDKINKEEIRTSLLRSVMKKAYMMLDYENLPDEIPKRAVKMYLHGYGHFAGFYIGERKVISWGGFSGKFDGYYFPTHYIVTNPYLGLEKNTRDLEIGKECIIVRNDSLAEPITHIVAKYVDMMTENEVSMIICDILARAQGIISAKDDMQMESAETYLKQIYAGKIVPIKSDTFSGENLESIPFGTAHYILTDLIEYEQYVRASLYSELGINLNFNMKRESLNSAEVGMDEEILKPYIDNMIEVQQEDFDMLSDFWKLETPIKVKKGSVWADMDLQDEMQEIALKQAEKNLEQGGTEPEQGGTDETTPEDDSDRKEGGKDES